MQGRHRATYNATNTISHESYEGSAEYLAKVLKVSKDRIYYASSNDALIAEMWKIEKVREEPKEYRPNHYLGSILQEWDTVTEPFKALSRRKAERAKQDLKEGRIDRG